MKYFRNLFFVMAVMFFVACEQRSVDDEIIADWRFAGITDSAGADVKKVGPEDLMRIRKDRTFTYKLVVEDNVAHGDWQVEGDKLIYAYDENDDGEPDYTRTYNIKEISDSTLILEEKGVDYRFRRERE